MQGVQAHPQTFWFVKNPGKIPENLGKIPENLDKIPENLEKSLKIRAKMALNFVRLQKMGPTFAEKYVKTIVSRATPKKGLYVLCGRKFIGKTRTKTFRASLGKVGQKSFASPKISLLLHLCIYLSSFSELTIKFANIIKGKL